MTRKSSDETEVEVEDQQEMGVEDADSPAAEGATEPQSMLEAVEAALATEKPEEKEAGSPPEEVESEDEGDSDESDPDSDAEDGDDQGDDQKDEEKDPPFHKHPRWKKVVGERDEWKQKAEASEAEASAYREIQSFVNNAGLTGEEVDAGLEMVRLIKHDPAKAWESLQPIVSSLKQFVGDELPKDLNDLVESGKMDEEVAAKFAKERAQTQHAQSVQARKLEQDRRNADKGVADAREAVKNAVTEWETNWSKSDPDFSKKHSFVRDRVVRIIRESGKMPATPAEAVDISNRAKEQIEAEMKGMLPRKREKRVVTGGAVKAKPEPKTFLEACKAGAEATR